MSGAAERMRGVLNDTGCYRLTGDSPGDWDLNACGAGLDRLEGELERLLGDLFVFTASPERLDSWEKLFRPQPSAGTLSERRDMALQRLSMNPARFSPGEFSPMLKAAGLAGEVREAAGGLRVVKGKRLGLTEGEVRRELDQVLPAHLPWEWVESMNWTALDAWAPAFSALDGKAMTWEEWDALTLEQLETMKWEET